jgi:hypothetical protein
MTRRYGETRPETLREAIAQTFDLGRWGPDRSMITKLKNLAQNDPVWTQLGGQIEELQWIKENRNGIANND